MFFRKRVAIVVGALLCTCHANSVLFAQRSPSPTVKSLAAAARSNFVSDASHTVATFQPTSISHQPADIVASAKAFLDSLDAGQLYKTNFPLKDKERKDWTNLPASRSSGGVRLGELQPSQIKLVCQLMANLMSDHGYRKMRDIMLADDQLLRNGQPRVGFGAENFAIVVFGKPSETDPWAFQIDGHHVGVNLAIQGEQISMSPSFIGTQPEKFEIDGHVFMPFQKETGMAYRLMKSLNDDQVKAAVLSQRRGRIVTGPGNDGKTPAATGLDCKKLDEAQKEMLLGLISQWVNDLPDRLAKARMEQIASEIDEMTLSWNGGTSQGSDISYRIQSPSLIIEYACQDLGGNPVAHLHSMYRNPKNEYGGQLSK